MVIFYCGHEARVNWEHSFVQLVCLLCWCWSTWFGIAVLMVLFFVLWLFETTPEEFVVDPTLILVMYFWVGTIALFNHFLQFGTRQRIINQRQVCYQNQIGWLVFLSFTTATWLVYLLWIVVFYSWGWKCLWSLFDGTDRGIDQLYIVFTILKFGGW